MARRKAWVLTWEIHGRAREEEFFRRYQSRLICFLTPQWELERVRTVVRVAYEMLWFGTNYKSKLDALERLPAGELNRRLAVSGDKSDPRYDFSVSPTFDEPYGLRIKSNPGIFARKVDNIESSNESNKYGWTEKLSWNELGPNGERRYELQAKYNSNGELLEELNLIE